MADYKEDNMELGNKSNIFGKIFSSQSDRGNYTSANGYQNYFISYIGVNDEDIYNSEIYNLNREINNRKNICLFKQNILNPDDFDFYLETFKYGMPPHGGFAIGLERLTMKILKLSNIREAALVPRDMKRLTP